MQIWSIARKVGQSTSLKGHDLIEALLIIRMRTYSGVDTTLRNHLTVERCELVDQGEILEKDGSSLGANSQAVFIVPNGSSVRSGEWNPSVRATD
jgi:hypothetical protein